MAAKKGTNYQDYRLKCVDLLDQISAYCHSHTKLFTADNGFQTEIRLPNYLTLLETYKVFQENLGTGGWPDNSSSIYFKITQNNDESWKSISCEHTRTLDLAISVIFFHTAPFPDDYPDARCAFFKSQSIGFMHGYIYNAMDLWFDIIKKTTATLILSTPIRPPIFPKPKKPDNLAQPPDSSTPAHALSTVASPTDDLTQFVFAILGHESTPVKPAGMASSAASPGSTPSIPSPPPSPGFTAATTNAANSIGSNIPAAPALQPPDFATFQKQPNSNIPAAPPPPNMSDDTNPTTPPPPQSHTAKPHHPMTQAKEDMFKEIRSNRVTLKKSRARMTKRQILNVKIELIGLLADEEKHTTKSADYIQAVDSYTSYKQLKIDANHLVKDNVTIYARHVTLIACARDELLQDSHNDGRKKALEICIANSAKFDEDIKKAHFVIKNYDDAVEKSRAAVLATIVDGFKEHMKKLDARLDCEDAKEIYATTVDIFKEHKKKLDAEDAKEIYRQAGRQNLGLDRKNKQRYTEELEGRDIDDDSADTTETW